MLGCREGGKGGAIGYCFFFSKFVHKVSLSVSHLQIDIQDFLLYKNQQILTQASTVLSFFFKK